MLGRLARVAEASPITPRVRPRRSRGSKHLSMRRSRPGPAAPPSSGRSSGGSAPASRRHGVSPSRRVAAQPRPRSCSRASAARRSRSRRPRGAATSWSRTPRRHSPSPRLPPNAPARRGRRPASEAALRERAPRAARLDVDLLRRLVGAAGALDDTVRRASSLAGRFEAPVRARADAGAERASQLGAELRRLGAAEVELRQEGGGPSASPRSRSSSRGWTARRSRRGGGSRRRVRRARTRASRAGGDDGAVTGTSSRRGREARVAPGGPREGQPAREGGVRGREGAPRGAVDPARGSRVVAPRAGGATGRARGDGSAPVRRDVLGGRRELRRGRRDPVPRR